MCSVLVRIRAKKASASVKGDTLVSSAVTRCFLVVFSVDGALQTYPNVPFQLPAEVGNLPCVNVSHRGRVLVEGAIRCRQNVLNTHLPGIIKCRSQEPRHAMNHSSSPSPGDFTSLKNRTAT